MKKIIILLFASICLGQSSYLGLISFDYSGSESGTFQAGLTDSSFSGASAIKTTSENGTAILISAFQPLDSVSISAMFIYLKTADTNLTSNEWILPPDDILNPDVVFGFFPVLDSSFFNQFAVLIPDSIALDSTILDSAFLAYLFTEILGIISQDAYVGFTGSINLNQISTDSMNGNFNVIAYQNGFPPPAVNITNGSIQLNGVTLPQVNVEDEPNIPKGIRLYPAYPNPFNPVTTIRFIVGDEYMPSLQINIFDLNGRLVETLVNGEKAIGEHEITWNGSHLPSGIYFVQLISGRLIQTQKLILMK
jgi:hypothetical protein